MSFSTPFDSSTDPVVRNIFYCHYPKIGTVLVRDPVRRGLRTSVVNFEGDESRRVVLCLVFVETYDDVKTECTSETPSRVGNPPVDRRSLNWKTEFPRVSLSEDETQG